MNLKYQKQEKLKSKTQIDLLFSEGKSVAVYPLRFVYVKISNESNSHKFGVSVSKKYFKKAVDRNYFKRVLREVYRQNKDIIFKEIEGSYAIMFFYQTAEKLSFLDIQIKSIGLFQKWNSIISDSKKKEPPK